MTTVLAPIEDVEFGTEMKESFRQYGSFVNHGRALPSILDGLKPVHRRILWGAYQMRAVPGRPRVKSAKMVGEVMGDFHPHGDSAIYATMVGMAQPHTRRVPLIDPQGNWGSLDSDAAAYRYTECRLSTSAVALLGHAPGVIDGAPEVEENAVDFVPNYSGSTVEPTLLPAMWPAFVVNGYEGIGVGIAGTAAQHNLTEVMDLAIRMVDSPNPRLDTVLSILPGPDLPTDCDIFDSAAGGGIESYITTGYGGFVMRARYVVEEYNVSPRKKGHKVVITGLPWRTSPEQVLAGVRSLVERKDLPLDVEVNNSSTKEVRIVIDIKENGVEDTIQRLLYFGRVTGLQVAQSVSMNGTINGTIEQVGVVDAIRYWIDHRRHVVRRRSRYRLERAEERLHVVEGFLKAIPIARKIVELVQDSDNRAHASSRMVSGDPIIAPVTFSEVQAQAILDMTISRLTKLGLEEYQDQKANLEAIIAECRDLLDNPASLDARLKKEMRAIRNEFGTDRRCTIRSGESPVVARPETEAVATPVVNGYLVRTGKHYVRWALKRSIKPLVGNDWVTHIIPVTDGNKMDCISTAGWQYRMAMGDLPDKMTKAEALFPLDPGETFVMADAGAPHGEGTSIVMVTKGGVIKRLDWDTWTSTVPGKPKSVINMKDDEGNDVDVVQHAFMLAPKGKDIGILTAYGRFLRLNPDQVAPKGRGARGLPVIRLQADDDRIVWSGPVGKDDDLLYWTDKEQVGWFAVGDVDRAGRNSAGKPITKTENYVIGAVVANGDTINYFDGSTEEPTVVELTGSGGTALTDRQLKVVAKGIKRANAVWITSS